MTGIAQAPQFVARELFRSFLPRDSSCGSTARRDLEAHLDQRLDGSLEDAKMIVSELVNNAFLHGEGQIELRVGAVRDRLRIEVIDQGHVASLVAEQRDCPGGLGLVIVDRLSAGWGMGDGNTHVWAELMIPASCRPL
jgi:anti-sigma regulatory factor (Ser/Thr protein kinase)